MPSRLALASPRRRPRLLQQLVQAPQVPARDRPIGPPRAREPLHPRRLVEGAENVELPRVTHYGYLIHPEAWRRVYAALSRG